MLLGENAWKYRRCNHVQSANLQSAWNLLIGHLEKWWKMVERCWTSAEGPGTWKRFATSWALIIRPDWMAHLQPNKLWIATRKSILKERCHLLDFGPLIVSDCYLVQCPSDLNSTQFFAFRLQPEFDIGLGRDWLAIFFLVSSRTGSGPWHACDSSILCKVWQILYGT